MTTPSPTVLSALREAARRASVDLLTLAIIASIESGLDPEAKARTSSALGLFQHLDQSWLTSLHRSGARHGYVTEAALIAWAPASKRYVVTNEGQRGRILEMRRQPLASALMGAEDLLVNAEYLVAKLASQDGRPADWQPDATDLYCAHFFGAAGAVRFFRACAATPQKPAGAQPDFAAAAAANPVVFHKKDAQGRRTIVRSFAQVWRYFDDTVAEHRNRVSSWAT